MSGALRGVHGLILGLVCAAMLPLVPIVSAEAAVPPDSPLFSFFADERVEGLNRKPYPSPGGGFEGPCGITVDSAGNLYVADYYHDYVDLFTPYPDLRTRAQLRLEDPTLNDPSAPGDPPALGGPCGLAVDSTGRFYVNNFHRGVDKFSLSPFPVGPTSRFGPQDAMGKAVGTTIDSGHSTGVAIGPGDNVYVDDRTYVAVYEPSGAPVLDEGVPLQIGLGSLKDGYGVAVSLHAGTVGYVYVADAGDDTVKVYDPTVDTESPIQIIDGHETPEGRFVSLRDAAIAIAQQSGRIFVADDLQPEYFARPEAAIYGFNDSGTYAGRLKYNIVDALPPGLAVDNSCALHVPPLTGFVCESEFPNNGNIFVTSGNSEGALVCGYGHMAGVLTTSAFPAACPAPAGASPAEGQGRFAAQDSAALSSPGFSSFNEGAAAHASETSQVKNIRVKMAGKLVPSALPRVGRAPISAFFAGHITTTDHSAPPQLQQLRIEINRHGSLDLSGLPKCAVSQIQPASTARALAACRDSLVGTGRFWANIVLSGQDPYPTKGRLLVFVGRRHGEPLLLGQIYSAHPFATSFVIPFSIRRIAHGVFGTELLASLPKALGNWGYVTAIEMTLSRRYAYRGRPHSFISAGCPAPKGFPGAVFPLARTSFSFTGDSTVTSTLTRSCSVKPGP